MNIRILAVILAVGATQSMWAQRNERDFVRKGNRFYQDSLYIKAEENYLKAIDLESGSAEAQFNLANSYLQQQKGEESYKQYLEAAHVMELERDKLISDGASEREIRESKERTAMAYHNMGVLSQAAQDYAGAVGAYKEALRNNPADDETRYNLALAMHMLKQQQQQQQDQQDQQQEQQQEQQEQQEQQQQEQQQQQQQEQQQQEEMSQENAEQLLQAATEDEKDVQERVKQMMQVQSKQQLEKDW